MISRKIHEAIVQNSVKYGLKPNEKSYVTSSIENLIITVDLWIEIEKELDNGQGSELKPDKNGIIKFNAVHSSSALCVNNFALIKSRLSEFSFLDYSGFIEASFEKKLPTGISYPNLDFYLENEEVIIGIESKFTETFTKKSPNKDGNLEKYLNRIELDYLRDSFFHLMRHYVKNNEKKNLDIAQLIKHTIGLINAGKKKNKKEVLVYIYWLPMNWFEYDIFKKHQIEIEEFKVAIKDFIDFEPLSYLDFWNLYEIDKILKDSVSEMRKRYEFNL